MILALTYMYLHLLEVITSANQESIDGGTTAEILTYSTPLTLYGMERTVSRAAHAAHSIVLHAAHEVIVHILSSNY